MELVRACSLTGYFAVAEQLGLDVTPFSGMPDWRGR